MGWEVELLAAMGYGFVAKEHPWCYHKYTQQLQKWRTAYIRGKGRIKAGVLWTHGQYPAE